MRGAKYMICDLCGKKINDKDKTTIVNVKNGNSLDICKDCLFKAK